MIVNQSRLVSGVGATGMVASQAVAESRAERRFVIGVRGEFSFTYISYFFVSSKK